MVLTQRFRDELRKQGLEMGLERGREEGREEGRQEGRGEGRAEERKAWVEWNQHRNQAMAEGREFTEAPPHEK